jgi:uncharacterized membrane protein (DUF4010 family)
LFAAIGYWRKPTRDPGMTTALALVVTYLLGVLAIRHPSTSAGGAVVVAVLLASRRPLHEFSVDTLSEVELRDGLLFAAATLILLPLLPDAPQSGAGGANPRRLWGLVVLFLALQAGGYVALRAAGPRLGLAFSGLLSGFVSSTGTIAALGARAREMPELRASWCPVLNRLHGPAPGRGRAGRLSAGPADPVALVGLRAGGCCGRRLGQRASAAGKTVGRSAAGACV